MELKAVIERLNQLYHQSQARELTREELAERDRLRRIYLDGIRNQVQTSLEGMKSSGQAEAGQVHQCGDNCRCGHNHRH
jgi:uncharacterized protein YnzC (UPF0291/DUF896 family)